MVTTRRSTRSSTGGSRDETGPNSDYKSEDVKDDEQTMLPQEGAGREKGSGDATRETEGGNGGDGVSGDHQAGGKSDPAPASTTNLTMSTADSSCAPAKRPQSELDDANKTDKHPTTDDPKSSPIPPPELEDPRMTKLRNQNASLQQQISETGQQLEEVLSQLKGKDPNKTVQEHIKLLHEYNEMRDLALGLMGLVAEKRGVVVGEVMREFGVEVKEA